MRNRWRGLAWALRAVWLLAVGLVALVSVLPPASKPIQLLAALTVADKLLHFGAYAALGLLPALHERRAVLVGMVALVMAEGMALEFAQDSVPGRSFEWLDMVANCAGVVTGAWVGLAIGRRYTSGGFRPSSR
jgi:VanZ family protein